MKLTLCIVSALFALLSLIAALSCALICAAAIWNGKRSGNFHIRHHIVRITFSHVLVAGFALL